MIVCPNCNHQNPDGAVQCEACYTPLPSMETCPNCNAAVQSDASFCGQCGFDLRTAASGMTPDAGEITSVPEFEQTSPGTGAVEIPKLEPPEPLISPDPVLESTGNGVSESAPPPLMPPVSSPNPSETAEVTNPMPPPPQVSSSPPTAAPTSTSTQLQINQARLLHVQTNTVIELSPQLNIIHIGKPNDRVPPTIDVSGFPDSEIVSRLHANIRVEGDVYYLEDVGSSNGTYINNMPLPTGNRHRLRAGDRIALGKGDKVSFIFQTG